MREDEGAVFDDDGFPDVTTPRGDMMAEMAHEAALSQERATGFYDNDGEWHEGQYDPGQEIDAAKDRMDDELTEEKHRD